ncbi:MAG: sulfotransferase family 2 domain-containing protein [Cocleimonas sp.]|nr:sulfotransferase family 2 domain-containing protein [Cocleimonas sp.]
MSDLWGAYITSLEKYVNNTSTEDLNYAAHVSLKHKYIYIETPKVACSTVKITLQRLELDDPLFARDDFEDLHNRDYSPLLKLYQLPSVESYLTRDDFIKFCFVREPYSRFLSCYLDKILSPTVFRGAILGAMGEDEEDDQRNISFSEFIEVVESQSPLEMNYHWRAQWYLTCQETIKYHYIGRLESFSEDFLEIGKKLSVDFPKYRTSEKRHKTSAKRLMSDFYNKALYQKVYDIYKIDFLNFGYEKRG